MNFIVLMMDTFRYDHLAANGHPSVKTPALDQFAAEATVFEQAYVGSFPTIPNRTDFFTGCWEHPFYPWAPLSPQHVTLPDVLGSEGYVTMLVNDTPHLINGGFAFDRPFYGWWMIRGNETDRWRTDPVYREHYPSDPAKLRDGRVVAAQVIRNGFGRHREEDYCSPRLMTAAMDWLEWNRKHERFFLWIDCFDPHEPWDAPQHYVDLYAPGWQGERPVFPQYGPVAGCLTPDEVAHVHAMYCAEITMVDRWVGRLLQKVDDLGLRHNTAIVVLSDHGYLMGEHGLMGKSSIYEEVAHELMMVRLPGGGAGQRVRGLVQPVDLLPSLLAVADVAPLEGAHGRSWAPAVTGGRWEGRPVAIAGGHPAAFIRQGHNNFPMYVTDGAYTLLDLPDPATRELFDDRRDPAQQHNYLHERPAIAKRLHEALVQFLREQGAPPALTALYERGEGALDDLREVYGVPPAGAARERRRPTSFVPAAFAAETGTKAG